MTQWFVLLRFGSCKPSPRWGGHKDWVSFNPFPLSNGHLDRVSFSPQSNGSLGPHKDHHTIGVSWFDYKCLGNKNGEEEKRSKRQEIKWTRKSLSLVTKCLEWFWTWERIWSLVCVLEWSLELLYWMQWLKTWILEWWWLGVFIAPTTKTAVGEGCCRWAHQIVRCAPDTVRCASHVTQPLGFWRFRPLELWQPGAPDSYCLVSGAPLAPALTPARTVHTLFTLLHTTVARIAVAPLGAPDSPVTHRTVRWIIAERLSRNPKVRSSACTDPGAPDTVRCARPRFSSVSFAPFFLNPNLIFLLVCVEPLAPVEYII
jgi:hypothetical protein